MYLRQHWDDPRLNNPAITEALDLNDPRLVQAIWKPEVYFPNAKEGEFQYVTVPNVLLRIEPAGHILYMLRYCIYYMKRPFMYLRCVRSKWELFLADVFAVFYYFICIHLITVRVIQLYFPYI